MRNSIAFSVLGMALLLASCRLAPQQARNADAREPVQQGKFQVLGIGGAGGMYTPAVSPTDPNLMFVSCDMSGTYRSTDGGKHWAMIHHRQLNSSRACRPFFLKDAILWVSGATPKISRDKGATWEPLVAGGLPWRGQVNRMAAAADDESALFFGTDAGELWGSLDGGATWTLRRDGRVHAILALGARVYVAVDDRLLIITDRGRTIEETALGFALGDPMAAGQGFLSLAGGMADGAVVLYGLTPDAGLFQSLDQGRTWKKVDQPRGCNEVLMASNQTRVAYAAQSGHGGAQEFFRTRDGGATWERCFRMTGAGANVEQSWVQTELRWGYYITSLGVGVSPTDARVALITTQGDFYITRDGGDSWQQLMNRPLGVLPGDPGPRYASNGLEVTSSWQYLFDPWAKGRVYIAYTDIGFCRSVDAGKSWTPSTHGSPWRNTFYQVVFDPHVPGRMYAAASGRHDIPHWTHVDANRGQKGGVVVSEDSGVTWRPLGKGLPELPCTSVSVDPRSSKEALTLYTTLFDGGVYKSTDGGRTWAPKNNGLGNPGNLHALSVQVHPKTGDLFCSITAFRHGNQFPVPGGLWKSINGGDSWTDITRDLGLRWPANFALDPQDPDVIYLTAATIPGSNEGGLYHTTDGGETWRRLLRDEDFAATGGASYVHCLYVNLHPTKPGHVYVGTAGHGLWMSPDAGKSWRRFEALPFVSATNVAFDPENPEAMYVCTFGGGVWRGHYLP